ncbi:hypothetical protein [Nocardia seriolae]|uniref:Type II toxin-antitoxin system PemK/MazF family toxin n=1 Tax=Nocardia seriolae TaxID=37332 RepID=A0A0B8N797_9NOCA|nr:hypothetical protein [Nocardia seriolae]APA99055.1 hypothetical protein NS506_05009 [Nocardia seriolae]MTJ63942.1 hypothetical protein [Nocardia seriolae]MTJ71011.1 hypothetical protein [Nocardia seriolae]MTJ88667.1 hypothetical protein [Nocardia seriolae]MTK32648.1 hypothetical protein [Nocardia seriolae]
MREVPRIQGEIWTLRGARETLHTVVVLDSVPHVVRGGLIAVAMVIPVREAPNPRALLTIPIAGTDEAVAVFRLATFSASLFEEKLGMLDKPTLENVRMALRARFDL